MIELKYIACILYFFLNSTKREIPIMSNIYKREPISVIIKYNLSGEPNGEAWALHLLSK